VLKKDRRNWSRYGHFIEDTQGILNSLQRWQVNHVSRNLNGAVYRLAKEALYVSEDQYFLEETPHIFRILSLLSNVLN
jgi:hypothetical protein